MGTVAIYRNIRIVIFSRDHWPPHVHAIGPEAEAVFAVGSLELIRNHGFDNQAINRIRFFLEEKRKELLETWHEIHTKEKN